jgi:hypothetical protein
MVVGVGGLLEVMNGKGLAALRCTVLEPVAGSIIRLDARWKVQTAHDSSGSSMLIACTHPCLFATRR